MLNYVLRRKAITSSMKYQPTESWNISFVYGGPAIKDKEVVWDQLKALSNCLHGPWVYLGDFSDISSIAKKQGGRFQIATEFLLLIVY